MQLTYSEALSTIIECTEIGYTLASQDRLWIVFIHDLTSEGEWAQFRYGRLYPRTKVSGGGWSYDLDMNGVLVWTTRAEAEAYAKHLREEMNQWMQEHPEAPKPSEVYVMNLGDDARYENVVLGNNYWRAKRTPKFKGSHRAWDAMAEMRRRRAEANR